MESDTACYLQPCVCFAHLSSFMADAEWCCRFTDISHHCEVTGPLHDAFLSGFSRTSCLLSYKALAAQLRQVPPMIRRPRSRVSLVISPPSASNTASGRQRYACRNCDSTGSVLMFTARITVATLNHITTVALLIFVLLAGNFFCTFFAYHYLRDRPFSSSSSTLVQDAYSWNQGFRTLSASLSFVTLLLIIRYVHAVLECRELTCPSSAPCTGLSNSRVGGTDLSSLRSGGSVRNSMFSCEFLHVMTTPS